MQLEALLISFALVSLAELGDKTQLTILTLSSTFPARKVFSGAALAYFFLTLLAVSIGTVFFKTIPTNWIKLFSAVLFIVFGLITFFTPPENVDEEVKTDKGGFMTAFSLISIMELGDKTQILTVALATKYMASVEVFTGAFLGLLFITFLGVVAGRTIKKYIKNTSLLHRLAGIVFIVLGIITLLV